MFKIASDVINNMKQIQGAINMNAPKSLGNLPNSISPPGLKDFKIGNKSITTNIDVGSRLLKANEDYFKRTGNNLMVTSSYRTQAQQTDLYNRFLAGERGIYMPSKTVGSHGYNDRRAAVDIGSWRDPVAIEILNQHGFRQSVGPKDPVHFQLDKSLW